MAVDKSFVVKNGLEVNSDLIVADASSKKVGIASTGPRTHLDVRGGIAATDGNFTGILTAATLDVTSFGEINGSSLNVTGFSTLGGLTVDQLTVSGFTTITDISLDEVTLRNLTITGIATVPTFTGLTSFSRLKTTGISTIPHLDSTNANVSGIATIATVDINAGSVEVSSVITSDLNASGVTTVANGRVTNLDVTGVATFTSVDLNGGDIEVSNVDTTDLNATGIATIATVDINAGDIEVSNVDTTDLNVTGIGTIATVDINAGDAVLQTATISNLHATGVTTISSLSVTGSTFDRLTVNNFSNLSGITTIDDPRLDKATITNDATVGGNLNVTGVATAASLNIGDVTSTGDGTFTGSVTATSFVGAGQIGIGTSVGVVGYGVSFIEFRGPGVSTITAPHSGITTITITGGGGGGSASIGIGSTVGDAFTGIITAGNLWYNTDLGRLFVYYTDDGSSQWVDAAPFNVGIITQLTSVEFDSGTVSVPSIHFGQDTNSGFFSPSDGSVSVSSNAVGILTVSGSGINVNGTVTGTSFSGDGSGLTGVASTDNIQTDTSATFGSNVSISGVTTTSTIHVGTALTLSDSLIDGGVNVDILGRNLNLSGIATAEDFDALSDINYKDNIETVSDALEKVDNLRGVRFNWKRSGAPAYGVIAQELEQVLPELVHGGAGADPKTVNYNGIIGVLIESIKELSARVTELENRD